MAYFEPYIDADGIHVPTYSDIMAYFTDQYKAIFGSDVYIGEETPDYQMMSVVARCIDDYSSLVVKAFNDRNPNYAYGNSLDILVQLGGLVRRTATASTVTLKITGVEGTELSTDSKAIDSAGNLWTIDSPVTIPASGTVEVGATCDTLGAVQAISGSIDGIYTPTPGWISVTNDTSATVGLDTETDAQLRTRFAASHSISSLGMAESLISGIVSISGVTSANVTQNDTDTDNTGSGGLPAHSFCAVVEGGEDEDVAKAIMRLKPPGVRSYGNIDNPITVVDEFGNENEIYFSRPTAVTVSIAVAVTDLGGYDEERINNIIIQSLMEDINNLGIGKSWAVTMGYRDIYSQFDSSNMPIAVTSITSTGATGGVVSCNFDQYLTTDADHITITEN